jgi:hypothetical protein
MRIVSIGGLALFMLTSLVVSIRLFALWRTTRKVPELLLATALFSSGFLAYAVGTLSKLLTTASVDVRLTLTLIMLAIECSGMVALIAFAVRVFHPGKKAAMAFAALLCGCIAAGVCGEVLSGEIMRYTDSEPIYGPYVPLGLGARGLGPAWMAFECFRYHAKLRRQRALGLVSRLVVDRVLSWGVGIGATAVAYGFSVTHRLIYGTGLREHDWALAIVSLLALLSALCIAFAFFPPNRYRRWAASTES